MRRIIAGIFICCFVLGTLFYVYYREKNSWSNFASNSPTEDSVLHNINSENIQIQEFEKTGFTGNSGGQVSISPNKEERLKIDNYEEVIISSHYLNVNSAYFRHIVG